MNNIFLIGFMGSGKTTVSECLHRMYGMEIVEMDSLISEQEGMSISDIFAEHGEEYFRSLETELLAGLRDKSNVVISCGGGTPMRENNVELMKKNGHIVLLTASPETIYERVRHSHDRPLLENHMNVPYIAQLMEKRRDKYEAAADIRVKTDQKPAEVICEEILHNITFGNERNKRSINPVIVGNVKIGEGMPKICVPIVGVTKEDILNEAGKLQNIPADLAEWRADWYEDVSDAEKVKEVQIRLRSILKDTPVLLTLRTAREGGKKPMAPDAYAAWIKSALTAGSVDLVDIEAFTGDDLVRELIKTAHKLGVKAVVSNHDFERTPDKDELVARLCKMQELGADICKIAVMPQHPADVLTLLAATEEMYRVHADRPVITMSMAAQGAVSRLCGEIFGSAVTFGSAGRASAPGQIAVEDLSHVLCLLHQGLAGE